MEASLVIPTYNESDNIAKIVEETLKISAESGLDLELVLVDDNSPDGTGKLAEELSLKYPGKIKVIHRAGKQGLSSAIREGISSAAKGIVVVTDADMSHEMKKIPALVGPIARGEASLCIGSRYVPGGSIKNWGFVRKVISRGAIILSLPLTRIKDPVSGFFALDKSIIRDVELNSQGYKILLEIIVKGKYDKCVEVPYAFTDRKRGKSKLDLNEFWCYLKTLYSLLLYKYSSRRQ